VPLLAIGGAAILYTAHRAGIMIATGIFAAALQILNNLIH